MVGTRLPFSVILCLLLFSCGTRETSVFSDDCWCSYRHDQYNSGVSNEILSFPLHKSWERSSPNAPQPAWPAPAVQDYWGGKRKLEPLVTYDRAFHPVVAGNRLFMSSSANNSIACYDVEEGELIWTFYTDGPNRVAPLWYKEKLFVGSDDGFAYCIDAANGRLCWKRSFGAKRKMIGNGRIISSVPIRTGIVARGDTVFIAAGLLPEEQVSINACHALSGKVLWSRQVSDLAPQGYPVLKDSLWYIPNSRVQPMAFSLENGDFCHRLSGDGGDNISVAEGRLVFGIDWKGELKAKRLLESAISGFKVTGTKDHLFVASDFSLTAIDIPSFVEMSREQEFIEKQIKQMVSGPKLKMLRHISRLDSLRKKHEALKQDKFLWQSEIDKPFNLINAANAVLVGQQNLVIACDPHSGRELWRHGVVGRPYGMAICEQRLFVSTDKGHLYCFGNTGRENTTPEVANYESIYSAGEEIDEKILSLKKLLTRDRGLLLVMGEDACDMVEQLTPVLHYHIAGLCGNGTGIESVRQRLDNAGLYGIRSTLWKGALADQQFSDYMFNVVVLEKGIQPEKMKALAPELFRVLSPSGGRIIISRDNDRQVAEMIMKVSPNELSLTVTQDYWVIERSKLPGSGEWTHLYANVSNTVSTDDAYATDKVRPLWFGQPGPREMSDRHHRAPAPLFKNGILYIPCDNGVMAADAYNGTLLWKKNISRFRRIKISRDAGNMAVGEKALYTVAENLCYVLDGTSGEEKKVIRVPQVQRGSQDAHWGYLATRDGMLFGSGRKPSAIFNLYSRSDWSEYSRLVTSEYLFGINTGNNSLAWTYRGGVILNPSICIGDDKMFFVESETPEAISDEDGLIPFNILKKKMQIVALDKNTGHVIWKKPYAFSMVEHILFGSYADGMLVLAGSGNVNGSLWYGHYVFDADSGALVWKKSRNHLPSTNYSHGEQIHRTLIMNGMVYTEPFAYDLKTGEVVRDWKLNRAGHGCGTISGGGDVLYFRATNPAACIPGDYSKGTRLNNISRPGCWINMIPAGGLLMIPEASSGCSCNFPLQMSIVYQPFKM